MNIKDIKRRLVEINAHLRDPDDQQGNAELCQLFLNKEASAIIHSESFDTSLNTLKEMLPKVDANTIQILFQEAILHRNQELMEILIENSGAPNLDFLHNKENVMYAFDKTNKRFFKNPKTQESYAKYIAELKQFKDPIIKAYVDTLQEQYDANQLDNITNSATQTLNTLLHQVNSKDFVYHNLGNIVTEQLRKIKTLDPDQQLNALYHFVRERMIFDFINMKENKDYFEKTINTILTNIGNAIANLPIPEHTGPADSLYYVEGGEKKPAPLDPYYNYANQLLQIRGLLDKINQKIDKDTCIALLKSAIDNKLDRQWQHYLISSLIDTNLDNDLYTLLLNQSIKLGENFFVEELVSKNNGSKGIDYDVHDLDRKQRVLSEVRKLLTNFKTRHKNEVLSRADLYAAIYDIYQNNLNVKELEIILNRFIELYQNRNEDISKYIEAADQIVTHISNNNNAISYIVKLTSTSDKNIIVDNFATLIPLSHFNNRKRIGSGNFGQVYRYEYTGDENGVKNEDFKKLCTKITTKIIDPVTHAETIKETYWLAIKWPTQNSEEFETEADTVNKLSANHLNEIDTPYNISVGGNVDGLPIIIGRLEVYATSEDEGKLELSSAPVNSFLLNKIRNENSKDIDITYTNLLGKMHASIDAVHEAGYLHLDISLRNFLMSAVDISKTPIELTVKSADFGYALPYDAKGYLNEGKRKIIPLRWANKARVDNLYEDTKKLTSATSDLYAFRIAMLETIAIDIDNLDLGYYINFNEDPNKPSDIVSAALKVKELGDKRALQQYVKNLRFHNEKNPNQEAKARVERFINNFYDYITNPSDNPDVKAARTRDKLLLTECFENYFVDTLLAKLDEQPFDQPAVEAAIKALLALPVSKEFKDDFHKNCSSFNKEQVHDYAVKAKLAQSEAKSEFINAKLNKLQQANPDPESVSDLNTLNNIQFENNELLTNLEIVAAETNTLAVTKQDSLTKAEQEVANKITNPKTLEKHRTWRETVNSQTTNSALNAFLNKMKEYEDHSKEFDKNKKQVIAYAKALKSAYDLKHLALSLPKESGALNDVNLILKKLKKEADEKLFLGARFEHQRFKAKIWEAFVELDEGKTHNFDEKQSIPLDTDPSLIFLEKLQYLDLKEINETTEKIIAFENTVLKSNSNKILKQLNESTYDQIDAHISRFQQNIENYRKAYDEDFKPIQENLKKFKEASDLNGTNQNIKLTLAKAALLGGNVTAADVEKAHKLTNVSKKSATIRGIMFNHRRELKQLSKRNVEVKKSLDFLTEHYKAELNSKAFNFVLSKLALFALSQPLTQAGEKQSGYAISFLNDLTTQNPDKVLADHLNGPLGKKFNRQLKELLVEFGTVVAAKEVLDEKALKKQVAEISNSSDKIAMRKELSSKFPNMSDYEFRFPKTDGANNPGEHGGVYSIQYQKTGVPELIEQLALIKQDTKKNKITRQIIILHSKNIAEVVAGRIMNKLIGNGAASVYFVRYNKGEGPDKTGENIYVCSIYYDNYIDLYKALGFKERPKAVGSIFKEEFTKGICKTDANGEIIYDDNGKPICAYKGLGPVIIASMANEDFDTHSGNFGLILDVINEEYINDKRNEIEQLLTNIEIAQFNTDLGEGRDLVSFFKQVLFDEEYDNLDELHGFAEAADIALYDKDELDSVKKQIKHYLVRKGIIEASLVKIDHGAALKNLGPVVHMHSHLLHLPFIGPTNHIREYPRDFKINEEFAVELERQANEDLDDTINEVIDEVGNFYGLKPIVEFASQINSKLRNDVKKILKKNFKEKDKQQEEEYKRQCILSVTKHHLIETMQERQKSLKQLALEVRISLCFERANDFAILDITNWKFRVKDDYQDTLKQLILHNPEYFLSGNFHFRGSDQRIKIIGPANIKAFDGILTDAVNDRIDIALSEMMNNAIANNDVNVLHMILNHSTLMTDKNKVEQHMTSLALLLGDTDNREFAIDFLEQVHRTLGIKLPNSIPHIHLLAKVYSLPTCEDLKNELPAKLLKDLPALKRDKKYSRSKLADFIMLPPAPTPPPVPPPPPPPPAPAAKETLAKTDTETNPAPSKETEHPKTSKKVTNPSKPAATKKPSTKHLDSTAEAELNNIVNMVDNIINQLKDVRQELAAVSNSIHVTNPKFVASKTPGTLFNKPLPHIPSSKTKSPAPQSNK